jgi:cyanophycinase
MNFQKTFQLTILVIALIPLLTFGQGKMIMVGGGSEGAWSDPAYSWGINEAANKKVGIVSYYEESQDLPKYFMDLGADTAVNIAIDKKTLANTDSIYNVLMSYDFLFFKGGDQANYYSTYKGTKVTQAITDKFKQGGVIGGTSAGMAILSGVMYTAIQGSSYPDDALKDFKNRDITLSNDFINLLPGYICDTHFIERGRVFRLFAFIARWYADTNETLTGIGVDDKTAFCIDQNQVGTAIGTGAVSIFKPQNIILKDNQFAFDSLTSTKLLDGHKYDLLNKKLLSPMEKVTKSLQSEEIGNYKVLLSGGESLSQQTSMLKYLIYDTGQENDTILIVSQSANMAESISKQISSLSPKTKTTHLLTFSDQNDGVLHRNTIKRSRKILFFENEDEALFEFLENEETGRLLKSHLKRNNIVSAFCGQDARYAGAFFTTNQSKDALASYRHQLNYKEGLSLLSSTLIMPNTLENASTDFYENTTSAVTYGLMERQLYFGIYLNEGTFVSIEPKNENVVLNQFGSFPSVIVTNLSEKGRLSTIRNVIAADKLNYSILLDGAQIEMGIAQLTEDEIYEFEEEVQLLASSESLANWKIYPNPVQNYLYFSNTDSVNFQIMEMNGRKILNGEAIERIDISNLKSGNYLIAINVNESIHYFKFIKE